MAHVEAFGSAFQHAVQLTRDGLRVVFERRTNGPSDESDAAYPDAGCDQIACKDVMRREFDSDRARSMSPRMADNSINAEIQQAKRVAVLHHDVWRKAFVGLVRRCRRIRC